MNQILSIIISTICLSACWTPSSPENDPVTSMGNFAPDTSLNGNYLGLVEMCTITKDGTKECYADDAEPERKWYHLTQIKIKGDSAYADQSPINIYKNDTSYSASDGAFYYYKGKVKDNVIDLELSYCDYCAISADDNTNPHRFPKIKQYTFKQTTKGLLIDGYSFKRVVSNGQLVSERASPD